jgi:fluoroquinolone transport system permease protein
MNKRILVLVQGELTRLHKYNLTTISVVVALIWGGMLYFVGEELLADLLPMVILMDATMMALMYVGAIMYYEKSESTISTLLVTPVSNSDLLLSKVIANTLHNIFSSALIIIVFSFLSDLKMNYFLLAFAILLVTAVHTIIGICMSYTTKDFTRMLMRVITFAFLLMIPSLLLHFEVINGVFWEIFNLANPINAALELISAGFNGAEIGWRFFVSLGYLLVGGPLLYKFYALPKFQDYAVRQSGV